MKKQLKLCDFLVKYEYYRLDAVANDLGDVAPTYGHIKTAPYLSKRSRSRLYLVESIVTNTPSGVHMHP